MSLLLGPVPLFTVALQKSCPIEKVRCIIRILLLSNIEYMSVLTLLPPPPLSQKNMSCMCLGSGKVCFPLWLSDVICCIPDFLRQTVIQCPWSEGGWEEEGVAPPVYLSCHVVVELGAVHISRSHWKSQPFLQ